LDPVAWNLEFRKNEATAGLSKHNDTGRAREYPLHLALDSFRLARQEVLIPAPVQVKQIRNLMPSQDTADHQLPDGACPDGKIDVDEVKPWCKTHDIGN
jgi:hypothetical protein